MYVSFDLLDNLSFVQAQKVTKLLSVENGSLKGTKWLEMEENKQEQQQKTENWGDYQVFSYLKKESWSTSHAILPGSSSAGISVRREDNPKLLHDFLERSEKNGSVRNNAWRYIYLDSVFAPCSSPGVSKSNAVTCHMSWFIGDSILIANCSSLYNRESVHR